jgi:hypothetical protein
VKHRRWSEGDVNRVVIPVGTLDGAAYLRPRSAGDLPRRRPCGAQLAGAAAWSRVLDPYPGGVPGAHAKPGDIPNDSASRDGPDGWATQELAEGLVLRPPPSTANPGSRRAARHRLPLRAQQPGRAVRTPMPQDTGSPPSPARSARAAASSPRWILTPASPERRGTTSELPRRPIGTRPPFPSAPLFHRRRGPNAHAPAVRARPGPLIRRHRSLVAVPPMQRGDGQDLRRVSHQHRDVHSPKHRGIIPLITRESSDGHGSQRPCQFTFEARFVILVSLRHRIPAFFDNLFRTPSESRPIEHHITS